MKYPILRVLSGLVLAATLSLASPTFADDTLDRGVGSEWSSLDPHVNFDAAAGWIQMDAYEGLISFAPSGAIIPGAAESWEASADGKTYTFHLRDGLKWSNGDPLTAQEYVDGILRTLNPATASEKGYYFYSVIRVKGAKALAEAETTDPATLGVTAPDARTVVIEMETPAPHILDIMGAFHVSPLHGPSFAANGAAGFIDPAKVVSNGAYVIKEVVPQSHVLLEANPNYWDAANVSIKSVKYHVTEDVSTELKRYQAGELDITYDIPLNQTEALLAEMPDQVYIYPSTQVDYYSFNLTKEPFQNIDLRRALALAIDRETLEGKIVKGGAIPTLSYAGGFDPTYAGPTIAEASMTQAERETLAKELYAKAGYSAENPLKITISCTVAEDVARRAQGVSLMWKKVLGVEATVEASERKAWLDIFYAGTWDVFGDNLVGDFAGAETFLAYMRPSAEPGYNWKSDAYEAAMDAASVIPDKPSRNAALAAAEKILLDDYIFAPIAIMPTRHLIKPNVKGFGKSVAGYDNSQFLKFE
ncbi:MAG: peptide ABC transporter substrate-binding protein [Paracoccaceae bacterium]